MSSNRRDGTGWPSTVITRAREKIVGLRCALYSANRSGSRGPHRREIDGAAQKETRTAAGVRRRHVQHERVKQNHVAGSAGVLDNSKRDAVVLLGVPDETEGP